jgi:hypothetical protein
MTALAFSAMTNATTATRRTYMRRTHVFFRVVDLDGLNVPQRIDLGATMRHPIMGGLGVRKLLYFRFWLEPQGTLEHVHRTGCAAVREHSATTMPDNPTLLYSWNVQLDNSMCQPCSDREVTHARYRLAPTPTHCMSTTGQRGTAHHARVQEECLFGASRQSSASLASGHSQGTCSSLHQLPPPIPSPSVLLIARTCSICLLL